MCCHLGHQVDGLNVAGEQAGLYRQLLCYPYGLSMQGLRCLQPVHVLASEFSAHDTLPRRRRSTLRVLLILDLWPERGESLLENALHVWDSGRGLG
jgi:hypothetical protein